MEGVEVEVMERAIWRAIWRALWRGPCESYGEGAAIKG